MQSNNFNFNTTAEEVATTFSEEIKNKNVLITGTSLNGIGFETARVIAKYASLVIITGYNEERLKLSEDGLRKEVPSANIRRLVLNLASLAGVRKAAAEVNAYEEPIHVLVNNAAAPMGSFKLTEDNLENQMATDHVGPFLFTKLIALKIVASKTAEYTPRVVFVASEAHRYCAGVDFDAITKPDVATYDGAVAYAQAKAANILTVVELAKRGKGKLNVYAVHPGVIFTNFNQHPEAIPGLKAAGVLDDDGRPKTGSYFQWKTIPEGAATTVAAAFDPSLNGTYLSDCKDITSTIAPHSSDPATAEKLWKFTEEIVGDASTF
ncbi:WW domain-containing oxidoreductase [Mycena rosella]|uniref:WW domain-containing oxidoreductase n=1 Tax=Mycena rosella TaxID=1033263 RepID=A0AAD7G6P6_MYCRO|nr:WW domain-containing oxidoreductase [Mycena rosella]